jgi:hypothetical protein
VLAGDAGLALALTVSVTLPVHRADLVTAAGGAVVVPGPTPVVRHTLLTVGSLCVAGAVDAVPTVASGLVEILVEEAALREVVALAG